MAINPEARKRAQLLGGALFLIGVLAGAGSFGSFMAAIWTSGELSGRLAMTGTLLVIGAVMLLGAGALLAEGAAS